MKEFALLDSDFDDFDLVVGVGAIGGEEAASVGR
jgi:hypothetical protein